MKITKQDILFVVLQFVLIAAYVFEIENLKYSFPESVFWIAVVLLITGAFISLVAVLQLHVNLSPFPSPMPGAKLITTGIFKYIRHPIYTGIFLAFFGFSFFYDSVYKLLISIVLLLLFYFKSNYEEKQLIKMFPEYQKYALQTGRFFPKVF